MERNDAIVIAMALAFVISFYILYFFVSSEYDKKEQKKLFMMAI